MSGRKLLQILLVFVAFVLAAAPASASDYYLWDAIPGTTWHDVDKTVANTDDDNLCWAAACSNVLDWGGWDSGALDTEAAMFEAFQNHWTDDGSYMSYGWDWYLNGTLPPRPGRLGAG